MGNLKFPLEIGKTIFKEIDDFVESEKFGDLKILGFLKIVHYEKFGIGEGIRRRAQLLKKKKRIKLL